MPHKDPLLSEAIREQASKRKHRRYGYRRITEILCILGWIVNHKRVYRIWRQEELRLPQKRQKRNRHNGNGLNACDQRPPEYMNHIWSYDIMEDKLENGRKVRILFASVEISYNPPEFEKAWGADMMFTHTAIGAYRPAYMDFYEIEEPRVTVGDWETRGGAGSGEIVGDSVKE